MVRFIMGALRIYEPSNRTVVSGWTNGLVEDRLNEYLETTTVTRYDNRAIE